MRNLAVKSKNGHAEVFDATTGEHIWTLAHDVVSALIDGQHILATRADGRVAVYNARTGAYIRTV
jgi:outer membrane protein assembly factor BamB